MKNSPKGKKGMILLHLTQGKTITGLEALRIYGVYRLSSTIHRLRSEGYDIQTTKKLDLFHNQYAEYKLIKES